MKERQYLTLDPKELSQPKLHGYLLAAVAPRPIAFASTIDLNGNVNLSPFSFFNVFSSNPPILIFSPARRGTDHTDKDTLGNVMEVPEVVINIVNYAIVEQMSLSSTAYDSNVNEFIKSGLTAMPADLIKPPRVAESPVALECMVEDIQTLGEGGGAGNLVICKVVKIHIGESYLDDQNKIDTEKMDLVARMGGIWYTRASGDALFQIPKPGKEKGIGVDALPDHVKHSDILTGNDLGKLGNLTSLPSQEEMTKARALIANQNIALIHDVQILAREFIKTGNLKMGLAILMAE